MSPVANSIDPFFFHIWWEREEEGREEEGEERLRIRGLRYERIEIEELSITRSEFEHGGQRGPLRGLWQRLEEIGEELEEIGEPDRHHDHDDDDD